MFSWTREDGRRVTWTSTAPAAPSSVANMAGNAEPAAATNTAKCEPERWMVAIEQLPITYPHKKNLLKEVKDQYSLGPLYKKVVDSPKSFKKFETADYRVYPVASAESDDAHPGSARTSSRNYP